MAAVESEAFRSSSITTNARRWSADEYYRKALTYLSSGFSESGQRAVPYFETLVEQLDAFGEGWFQLARLSFYRDELETACAQAAQSRLDTPENPNYHLLHAIMAAATGLVEDANTGFRNAALLRPDLDALSPLEDKSGTGIDGRLLQYMRSVMTREILPDAVFVKDRLLRADKVLEAGLEILYAPDVNAQEDGEEILQRLVQSVVAPEPAFHLALRLARKSRLEQAEGLCAEVLELFPNDWRFLALRGYIRLRAGRPDAGANDLEEAALRNHRLPLLEDERLDDAFLERLAEWYERLFEQAPKVPGGYVAEWMYPQPFAQTQDDAARPLSEMYRGAWQDIRKSFGQAHLWMFLARNDMIGRYRRTVLGPWWIVLGTAVALGGMAVIWSVIFGIDRKGFLPYLACGYLIWIFTSSVLVEGCDCFAGGQAASLQKNIPCGQFTHVLRLVTRLTLMMGHQSIIVVLALIFGEWSPQWSLLLVLPALGLLLLTATAIATLFGIIGARFRDFGPAVGALLNVLFFLTPVVWKPEMLGQRAHLALFNPLTHYIDILRAPITGGAISLQSWLIAAGCTVVLLGLAFHLFARARARIVYWL